MVSIVDVGVATGDPLYPDERAGEDGSLLFYLPEGLGPAMCLALLRVSGDQFEIRKAVSAW